MNRTARALALLACLAALLLPALALAGHTEAHGGTQPINWFDFSNPTTPPLIATIVNFLLLVAAVWLIMRKPIGNMVRTRRDNLAAALEEARKAQEEAEAELAEARARFEALDVEMARLRKEILEGGHSEAKHIAAGAGERAERMKTDTETMIQQEVARLAEAIRAEAVAAIVSRAEATLREKIERADHDRLAREYVTSVSAISPPGAR